eukprot:7845925-Pyramimonas_sp.AAC.1
MERKRKFKEVIGKCNEFWTLRRFVCVSLVTFKCDCRAGLVATRSHLPRVAHREERATPCAKRTCMRQVRSIASYLRHRKTQIVQS